jgi:hypothetical protein
MATTLTLLAVNKSVGPFEEVIFQIALTGNYTQGGDTVNLQSLQTQVDLAGRSIDSELLPVYCEANSVAAVPAGDAPQYYQLSTYTNPESATAAATQLTTATMLLSCYSGVTEVSTGAYPNAQLSDVIIAKMTIQSQR